MSYSFKRPAHASILRQFRLFKRLLLLIGFLFLVIFGVMIFGTMEDQVRGLGTVAGIREYDLKALVSARTFRILHYEGEFVQRGEALLEFEAEKQHDQIKMIRNEIKELELEISVKEKALKILRKDPLPAYYRHTELELATARERFVRTEREVEVYKRLFEQRVITRREFLRVEMDHLANRMAVQRLEDDLKKLKDGMATDIIDKAEEELRLLRQKLKTKQDELDMEVRRLEDYIIRAPDAGIITDIPPRPGGYYERGEVVVKFAANQNKKVIGLIDEKQVYKVEPGQPVRIYSNQYNYWDYGYFEGEVDIVYQLPIEIKGVYYYPVKILLTREQQPLRFGSSCEVTIVAGRERIIFALMGIRSKDYLVRRGLIKPKTSDSLDSALSELSQDAGVVDSGMTDR